MEININLFISFLRIILILGKFIILAELLL